MEREGEPAAAPRRRAAAVVTTPLRGGVDVGGTKIQAVVTGRAGKVVGQARRNTPVDGPEAVANDVALTITEAAASAGVRVRELSSVGVGAPGSIDATRGEVLQVANIGGWDRPFPLGPVLAERFGVPVSLGNDVSVAVEAERRYGAGRGVRSFLGVFWGTGVGGGLVLDGRLVHGRGSAGEIGHVCVKPGGRRCNCGLRGCVEAYAGRGALEQRARREARKRKTILFDLQHKRGRESLTSGIWLRALDAGDAVATDLLAEAVQALAVAIGSAVTLTDVELVVMGGGLGERLGGSWLKRIEKAARRHTFFRPPPAYRLAELGDMGGAIGASLLGHRTV
jgi:glucokinase